MAHSATFPTISPPGDNQNPSAAAQVLTIGPWKQREFTAAIADIPAARDWRSVIDIDDACEFLSHCDRPPELLLFAQPFPGQVRQANIDHLQQLVPLARLVIVAGTWCEGELRTGTPPTGVIRLYWYELSLWWQAASRRRDAGLCPLWSLPLDHPQAGRCSPEHLQPAPPPLSAAICIDTADLAVYETLAAALNANDMACYRNRVDFASSPTVSIASAGIWPTAGIWDGGQLDKRELQRLTTFCGQVAGCDQVARCGQATAPVIALLDFPRVDHIGQARAAGATAVLAKPYVVEELVMLLSHGTGSPI